MGLDKAERREGVMAAEENKPTPKGFDGIKGSNKPKEEKKPTTNRKISPFYGLKRFFQSRYIAIGLLLTLVLALTGFEGYQRYQSTKKTKSTKVEAPTQAQETPKTVSTEKLVYVAINEGLRLREAPSFSSRTLQTLPYGAKLTVLKESENWYQVAYNETSGWCVKAYVSATKPKELSIRDVDFSKIVDLNKGAGSLQPIQYADYNKDGYEEALVTVLFDGTGGYREFYVYGYKDGLTLTKYLDLRPATYSQAFVDGYAGHDALELAADRFVLSYPVYKPEDPNCCPTGGKEYVYLKWNGTAFAYDNKTNG